MTSPEKPPTPSGNSATPPLAPDAPPPRATDQDVLVWSEVEAWAKSLPHWQRWIVRAATNGRQLSPADMETAWSLLLRNEGLSPSDADLPDIPVAAPQPKAVPETRWRLRELRDLRHVNALTDRARLPIGDGLTVVYGTNGSGKSGFARLLASVCQSRGRVPILPNVHAELPEDAVADASIVLCPSGDGSASIAVRVAEGGLPDALLTFSVFDTTSARASLAGEHSLPFTPAGMDVFLTLATAMGQLSDRLQAEVGARRRPFTFVNRLMPELAATEAASKLAVVEHTLDTADVRVVASSREAADAEASACRGRILHLKTLDLTGARRVQAERNDRFRLLRQDLRELRAELANGAREARRLLQSFADALATATAESAAALRDGGVRAGATPEWARFVDSARAVGRLEARAGAEYPEADAPCLLCQRPLDDVSLALLRRIWSALDGDAKQRLDQAEAELAALSLKLGRLNADLVPPGSVLRLWLSESHADALTAIDATLSALDLFRRGVLDAIEQRGALPDLTAHDPVGAMDEVAERLAGEMASLESLDPARELEGLHARLRQCLAVVDVAELLSEVEAWVVAERWSRKAEAVLTGSLKTTSVTAKRNEIFAKVVKGPYYDRLRQECAALGCAPPDLTTKGRQGDTVRSLEVGHRKPELVLSEGEHRAVALADFLTEVGLDPTNSGIILDDPVTSMDQKRKANIATRLVAEAQHRQVIIFTHDLVFLQALITEAEERGAQLSTHWVERDGDGAPGFVTADDVPVLSKSYQSAHNAILALSRAKNETGAARERALRDGMGSLRRTLEELVLKHLFKGTVSRWDEQIHISRIRDVDWSPQLADDVYTAFCDLSRFVGAHSHSEQGGTQPEIEMLATMIKRVEELIRRAKGVPPIVTAHLLSFTRLAA